MNFTGRDSIKNIILLITFTLILASCSGGGGEEGAIEVASKPSTSVTPTPIEEDPEPVVVTLDRINVSTDKVSLSINEVATLTAIGYYSDGSSSNISTGVTWSSSDSSKISINSNQATALAAGSVIVTATSDGVSSSLTLLPFSANLTGIELNVNSLELPSDGEFQLLVSAVYDNGQSLDITDEAQFVMDDSSVALIDELNNIGRVSSNSAGTTSLTISYNGLSKSLPITITTAVITELQVTPIVGSKVKGASQSFYATGTLDSGETIDLTESVVWSSSSEGTLSIDADGVASLVESGSVTVSASYAGLTSSVNFTVTSKTISSLALSFSAASISTSVTAEATCIAHYNDGSSEDVTDSVSYSVNDSSIGIVSNNQNSKGKITPISAGVLTLTASLGGTSISEDLTITEAQLVSISVETNESLISSGINAYFRAMGTYDDSSVVEITDSVIWSLSNSDYGSISNSSQDRGLYTNTFDEASTSTLTITASMEGVDGTIDILLAPGTISSISITPQSAVMNTNESIDFKAYAHFSDGASVEITDISTWSSSDTSVVIVSNSRVDRGRVSSLNEGAVNVTASYNGMNSGSSSIDVDNSQTPGVITRGDGLLASYYNGRNFDTFKGQRIDSQIGFSWESGNAPLGVGDYFSVRWTGQIEGKYTGDCQVSSYSDDGFRVWINGDLVIDDWSNHAPRWRHNYAVPFVEGEKQDILVEFYENSGRAVAQLHWTCPGDSGLELIPTEYLYSN